MHYREVNFTDSGIIKKIKKHIDNNKTLPIGIAPPKEIIEREEFENTEKKDI